MAYELFINCMENKRKIIYVDMDNTLADYLKHAEELNLDPKEAKHVYGFFRNLKPIPGAIEAYNKLAKHFDVYLLTTAPWSNPYACVEKFEWVKEYLPNAYKNLIISHHKELNMGDYLIDDSTFNGAAEFPGKHIQIWSKEFPTWESILNYLIPNESN